MKLIIRLSLAVTLLFIPLLSNAAAQNAVPNPVLYMTGSVPYTTGGRNLIRYEYAVWNFDGIPNALFAAAPSLPPCGKNTQSSRTWVDIYDQRGTRLTGFCALGKSNDLNGIWFGLPVDELPPSWIYIELTDRQTGTKYKSNLAETTM